MVQENIRFGLVGCGAVAAKHVTVLNRIEAATIAAVCDTNLDAARSQGNELGVPYFSDAREMADAVDFDVFSILTPSGDHARSVLNLASFGRHFLVEKPLALAVDDAAAMIDACESKGVNLLVVNQNRYNRPVLKLKEAVNAGRFGKMVMGTVRVRWAREQEYYDSSPWRGTIDQDGGVLANQAAHHIDMLLWLMGDVREVMAMKTTRLADIEADDTAVAVLTFADGSLGLIEATTATRPRDLEGSISILGERGSVEIGGFFMNEMKAWNFVDAAPGDDEVVAEWGGNPDVPAWNLEQYLRDMVGCLQQTTAGPIDALAGLRAVRLFEAIERSVESKSAVHIDGEP